MIAKPVCQRNILVVDDEPLVCETLAMLLEFDGRCLHGLFHARHDGRPTGLCAQSPVTFAADRNGHCLSRKAASPRPASNRYRYVPRQAVGNGGFAPGRGAIPLLCSFGGGNSSNTSNTTITRPTFGPRRRTQAGCRRDAPASLRPVRRTGLFGLGLGDCAVRVFGDSFFPGLNRAVATDFGLLGSGKGVSAPDGQK